MFPVRLHFSNFIIVGSNSLNNELEEFKKAPVAMHTTKAL
jgi:hypothetical protein